MGRASAVLPAYISNSTNPLGIRTRSHSVYHSMYVCKVVHVLKHRAVCACACVSTRDILASCSLLHWRCCDSQRLTMIGFGWCISTMPMYPFTPCSLPYRPSSPPPLPELATVSPALHRRRCLPSGPQHLSNGNGEPTTAGCHAT